MATPTPKTSFRAIDAFYCALALIVTDKLVLFWVRFSAKHSWNFYYFWESTTGLICSVSIQGLLWLFWALWFSRALNTREFILKLGLNQKINPYGYVAAWVAILIVWFEGYYRSHWEVAVKNVNHIDHALVGSYYVFFVVETIFLMPFVEEIVNRGFMYSALREKYKMPLCVFLIVVFSIIFHWGTITSSFSTFFCLTLSFILFCVVRENTKSLWNCILCHGVSNAAAILLWYPTIILMICLLPFVLLKARDSENKEVN